MKKRLFLIGASVRVGALVKAVQEHYADGYEFCACLDSDRAKMADFLRYHHLEIPQYGMEEFDTAVTETHPDIAVITTTDATHAGYIVRALDSRISCMVEKPLCINENQCREILAAQKRNPEVYAVTMHNSRYHACFRKTIELVKSGAIGEIKGIFYNEKLDLFHGSSYYRRWNRDKKLSGGLQIHKSSHHFDKINFLLKSKVEWVSATGCLTTYGAANSPFHGEKCSTCAHAENCRFYLNYHRNEIYEKLYSNTGGEIHAYTPDNCVFSPEVSAEDFFQIFCMYENKIPMSYSLSANCHYEGESLSIEGTAGRLEMNRLVYRTVDVRGGEARNVRKDNSLRIVRFQTGETEIFNADDEIQNANHGGCDERIYEDLFGMNKSEMLASFNDGIQAVLVGIGANLSMAANGRKIYLQPLLEA